MNLHVSVLGFLTTALYIIIFGFLWRWASARWSDTPLGKAMGVIF
jgi:hypothetical protein